MHLHQTPPGRGGKPTRVHWTYVSTEAGSKNHWSAHVAGKCHWFTCHEAGRTKPCLDAITQGVLSCPFCAQLLETKEVGYQPLYRESDGKPVIVIVHDYSREIIDRLNFHERVLIGRGVGITDAVYIVPSSVQTPRYKSTLPERNKPADATESLLRMWKISQLTEFYFNQRSAEEPMAAQPIAPVIEEPEPMEPPKKIPFPAKELANVMDKNAEKARAHADANERNAAWLRQQAEKPNGNHKKK